MNKLLNLLCRVLGRLCSWFKRRQAVGFRWEAYYDTSASHDLWQFFLEGKFWGRVFPIGDRAMILLLNNQTVQLTAVPVDARGYNSRVDGVPVWTTSDPGLVSLTPAADGLSCQVASLGPVGTALVTVTGDADLGAGVAPITGTIDVIVEAGQAVSFLVVAGTPTNQ